MKILQTIAFSVFVLVAADISFDALDKQIQNNNAQQRAWAMEASDD